MFKTPGNFDCTIIDAFIAEPKFGPKDGETMNSRGEQIQIWYDVCLLLQDANGNTDTWHGEMSNRDGFGNRAHMQRWEITLETLRQIGFNVNTIPELEMQFVPNQDGSASIPNMLNLKCTAVVEASTKVGNNGQPFVNIKYITALGGGGPRKLTMAEIMQRRGVGMPAAAPVPPSAPAPAPAAPPNWNPPTMQAAAPAAPAAPQPPAYPGTAAPKCPY